MARAPSSSGVEAVSVVIERTAATIPVAALTTVRVRDLQLLADVGINPDEIGRRQPLVVTVELVMEATSIEAIDETVDYRRIVAAAEAIAQVHTPLIEAFGRRLAGECLSWGPVREARVSIDKPFALTRGLAGVEVILRRAL